MVYAKLHLCYHQRTIWDVFSSVFDIETIVQFQKISRPGKVKKWHSKLEGKGGGGKDKRFIKKLHS